MTKRRAAAIPPASGVGARCGDWQVRHWMTISREASDRMQPSVLFSVGSPIRLRVDDGGYAGSVNVETSDYSNSNTLRMLFNPKNRVIANMEIPKMFCLRLFR